MHVGSLSIMCHRSSLMTGNEFFIFTLCGMGAPLGLQDVVFLTS